MFGRLGSDMLKGIPWTELKGKITFITLPDGKLSIRVYSIDGLSISNGIPIVLSIPELPSTNSAGMMLPKSTE